MVKSGGIRCKRVSGIRLHNADIANLLSIDTKLYILCLNHATLCSIILVPMMISLESFLNLICFVEVHFEEVSFRV